MSTLSNQDLLAILGVVAVVVSVIALIGLRQGSRKPDLVVLQALVTQLHEGVQAHQDVSQVLAILDKLKDRRGDPSELTQWAQSTVVAAFMVRINGQLADIAATRAQLSVCREAFASGCFYYANRIELLEVTEQRLAEELEALYKAASVHGVRLPEVV